jgi:hypothetical protein
MKKDTGKKAVLEQLIKTPIVEVACSKAGIGKTSFYQWKNDDPEFAKAVNEAMKVGIDFISDVAESQLITLIKKGNFSAVAYWLKHNRNERYGEKLKINGTVEVREELTEEEFNLIERATRHINGID